MSERNLNAYYYEFFETGSDAIDSILESVARAGKAYHHTGEWGPSGIGDNTPSDWIQDAANIAAERDLDMVSLLHAAKCPQCDGSGAVQAGPDDIYQCQWCCERDEALAKHKQQP